MTSSPNYLQINQENLKLIYLSILSLEIPLESLFIPEEKVQVDFLINSLVNTLRKNDELIRRAVSLLEQIKQSEKPEDYYGLVQEYLTKFTELSHSHPDLKLDLDPNKLEAIALKLLANLLFYSSQIGENLLQHKLYQSSEKYDL